MMKIVEMPEFKDKQNKVFTLEEDTSLIDAIKAMADYNYGAVVVTKNGKLSGIFTERDVLRRVMAKELDIAKLKLRDVMTKNPSTASTEDRITDSMRRMSQGRFRHLPVIDIDNNVVGILSQGDFVALTMSDAFRRFTRNASATLSLNYQIMLILGGVLAYTIILLSFLG